MLNKKPEKPAIAGHVHAPDATTQLKLRVTAKRRLHALSLQVKQQQYTLRTIVNDLTPIGLPVARLARLAEQLDKLQRILDDEAGQL